MKAIVGFVLLCVLLLYGISITKVEALAYNYRRDLTILRNCNKTSPLSLDALNSVLMQHEFAGITSKELKELKCFLHCVFTKYDWMDSDGEFYETNIKDDLNESTLDKLTIDWLVYKCTDTDSKNKCDRAYDFTFCFWKETKKNHDQGSDVWKF